MKDQRRFNDGMNDVNGYRPSLTFYHANCRGTGCALKVILRPATETYDGYLELRFADQVSVGGNGSLPRFDWENYREIYLDFDAISKMLQVFRGECESIDDGRGLYIRRDSGASLRFNVTHLIEPACGYDMRLLYHPSDCDKYPDDEHHVFLTPPEALGLCEAISGSLYMVAFGRPSLIGE